MDNAVRLFGASRRHWGALWAGLLSGCWPAAGAESAAETGGRDLTEMSLEELGTLKVSTVYGASKHEQKTSEAPSSVSIVTPEDINILDKRYWDPGEPGLPEDSLQQDGRTFRIKLTYRF
jgi:hypothetical protein